MLQQTLLGGQHPTLEEQQQEFEFQAAQQAGLAIHIGQVPLSPEMFTATSQTAAPTPMSVNPAKPAERPVAPKPPRSAAKGPAPAVLTRHNVQSLTKSLAGACSLSLAGRQAGSVVLS